jgi:hypothetical protein
MIKRMICFLLVSLLALASAYAEGASLPTVTDAQGQSVAFSAAGTDAAAPEDGDWNRSARAISGLDAEELDNVRTLMAIKTTELDFNSYALMTYDEKVSVVVALLDEAVEENGSAFYAEGDEAPANSVVSAYVVGAGDFAVFALTDGAWANVGMFSLTGDAAAERASYLFDLSCYALGDSPAYVARFNETDGAWHVVGFNQAYVDAAIAACFY